MKVSPTEVDLASTKIEEQLVIHTTPALIHTEDVAGIVEKWRTSLATGEPFEAETRVRRADGVYRWFLHRKVALRDDCGKIVRWYGSSIDIEDRKQAEDALRRSEAYLAEA